VDSPETSSNLNERVTNQTLGFWIYQILQINTQRSRIGGNSFGEKSANKVKAA
jgi:hypothetical protein